MQRQTGKGPSQKDLRVSKLLSHTSKNKKQSKQTSSKNLKTIKGMNTKSNNVTEQIKMRQTTSPQTGVSGQPINNDYGVNPYYVKYKVKTNNKKQSEEGLENTDYGTFNSSRDAINTSQYQIVSNRGNKLKTEESDYAQTAFQKIKLPTTRGLINAQGKFVTATKAKQPKHQSFHNHSTSKHSFSLNFTARDQSRYRKKGKSKSKSKRKIIQQQKSLEYKTKSKSAQKIHLKQPQNYYQKTRQDNKEHQLKPIRKQKKVKTRTLHQIDKLGSINSKSTSIGTEVQVYSALGLTQDNSFIERIKDQIYIQIGSKSPEGSTLYKSKLSEHSIRQRSRCISMVSRICGALSIKKQAYFLATHYLDQYITQYPYQSMKLVCLGSLTLALKMDDAEMISRFCYHYLYNPQRTVKKSGSTNNMKLKQKSQSVVGKDQHKSKLAGIINTRISEEKKLLKQDFSLEEVLDFQTQIMVKFGFKLTQKTVGYWVDMLTALWDSYVEEFCPKYADILIFRNERTPRNLSYIVQMVELECLSMGLYSYSKVSMVLAAIYLISRIALEQKKEETPWHQICKSYKQSLSKTTNLIFCDGVGINTLFGDFLTLFELSMANIIDCVQLFSKYLQPNLIRITDYRKLEGLNRQDRLSIHVHCQQLYRPQPL